MRTLLEKRKLYILSEKVNYNISFKEYNLCFELINNILKVSVESA